MYEVDATPIVHGPTIRVEDLDAQAFELMDAEQEALLALGQARLRGLPGSAARAELRRVRESLEGVMAASRVLEAVR